jgi:hypothetical protein
LGRVHRLADHADGFECVVQALAAQLQAVFEEHVGIDAGAVGDATPRGEEMVVEDTVTGIRIRNLGIPV